MVHLSLVHDIWWFASGSSSRIARRGNSSTLPSLGRTGTAPRPRGSTTAAQQGMPRWNFSEKSIILFWREWVVKDWGAYYTYTCFLGIFSHCHSVKRIWSSFGTGSTLFSPGSGKILALEVPVMREVAKICQGHNTLKTSKSRDQ